MTLQSLPKPAILERINFRLVAFIAVICCFVGYPLYQGVKVMRTGGIVNHGDYMEVDLKSMSNFEMDQNDGTIDNVPPQFRALDGKKIECQGEMWNPNGAGDRVDSFVLVYSIARCCVGGNLKVQHLVYSSTAPGKDVRYYTGQVRVVGTLHVKMEKEGGKIQRLYSLDVEKLEAL